MKENLERIKTIKIENFIWVIVIILVLLSIYGNFYEEDYFKTNNLESKEKYRSILIFVFSVAIIIYLYFFYDSYISYEKAQYSKDQEYKTYVTANLIASLLIAIAGAIFLWIAIADNNLKTEISFT